MARAFKSLLLALLPLLAKASQTVFMEEPVSGFLPSAHEPSVARVRSVALCGALCAKKGIPAGCRGFLYHEEESGGHNCTLGDLCNIYDNIALAQAHFQSSTLSRMMAYPPMMKMAWTYSEVLA